MMLLFSAVSQIFFLLSYISSSNAFPKPMTAKEEREALKKMAEGDAASREQLIEKNLRLVVHITKKYQSTGYDPDDLVSIGTIGLIKAVNTFDAEKGIRLATYAARCIENEILMVIRSGKKTQNDISFEEPIGVDKEGNEISLMDIVSANDDVVETVTLKMQIAKLYEAIENTLTERERNVIVYRYGLNNTKALTQREVAELLGVSRSYVSRIEKKTISKLAQYLKEK